jgi:negative regulator of sigma E activity
MIVMDDHEAIAALVDGERVDAESLKHALSQADGRDYLIDLLALRELVAERGAASSASASAAVPRAPRVGRLAAAAAIVLATALGGYFVGTRSVSPVSGPAGTLMPVASAPDAARTSAPAPTRVIRLQPGVDWQERKGGN